MKARPVFGLVALAFGLFGTSTVARATGSTSRVLIRASKPYSSLEARISSLGGHVVYRYRYVDAIAAELPISAVTSLRDIVGTGSIIKDDDIPQPGRLDVGNARSPASASSPVLAAADAAEALGGTVLAQVAAGAPNGYLYNGYIANVSGLHAAGIGGAGVVVAVLDTGIRPGFPHLSLDGSVIGCEDFVGDGLGCVDSANSFHGTFVAGMISANATFLFDPDDDFRNAVLAECPACFSDPPAYTAIPMIGTAPLSSIYMMRVFGGGDAPTSRALAAMERVIELRERFDAGLPGGVNIQVVNMSFGYYTLLPGRGLLDIETDVMLEKGIVPVVGAGNGGPSSITVTTPGTASSAITVGAAALPHNMRIIERLSRGPIEGPLAVPFSGIQMADFSSRGPNADGRTELDVVSSGTYCFGQGIGDPTTISFLSGTSVAAPSVAGVAALLREAHPAATARQIRNAIIESANPYLLGDNPTVLDQGHGYVNGAGASELLTAGDAPDTTPSRPRATSSVIANIERGTFLRVLDAPVFVHTSELRPGERYEVLLHVAPNTRQVMIDLSGVTPSLPPEQQNQIWGDDTLLGVHTAKTSGLMDYLFYDFTSGLNLTINDPEPGVMRVTLLGSFTNAGTVAADISILTLTEPIPQLTTQGRIADQQALTFPVSVGPGVAQAEFRLEWHGDWGSFPPSDIDLILIDPSGGLNFAGATLNSPESVVVAHPAPGTWQVVVLGFEIHSGRDRFELRASLDGDVVRYSP